jgi:hypothetical protein
MPLGTATLSYKETNAAGHFVYEETLADPSDVPTLTLKPKTLGEAPKPKIHVRVTDPTLGG